MSTSRVLAHLNALFVHIAVADVSLKSLQWIATSGRHDRVDGPADVLLGRLLFRFPMAGSPASSSRLHDLLRFVPDTYSSSRTSTTTAFGGLPSACSRAVCVIMVTEDGPSV